MNSGKDALLIGKWTGSVDGQTVEMEFTTDGRLTYTIHAGKRLQIMHLVYRVEADTLITDQPSHPREERTKFRFDEPGRLLLDYEGRETRFARTQG
jgi:hypothetical protein